MPRSRTGPAKPSSPRRAPAVPAEPTAGGDALIRINRPALAGGIAVDIVRGSLFVDGFTVAADGVASLTIDVDGQYVADMRRNIPVSGAAKAFPDRAETDIRGFSALIPAWALANGPHRVAITLITQSGSRVQSEFAITVGHNADETGPGALRCKMPLAERRMAERVLAGLGWQPNFALLLGIGELDAEINSARRTLASLRDQVYGAWRVTVLRRGRVLPDQAATRLLDGFGDIAARIDIQLDAPPQALLADLVRSSARGGHANLVGVLLAGDVLGCDALLEMAIASGQYPDAEFFYSDERRLSPASGEIAPFFKPQWSPDLLTATNYIGRFWCTLPALLGRVRATMGEWFQFGDYDLVLRCTEATSGIHHVAKMLSERGRPQLDHPDQERAALARAMQRRGVRGAVGDSALAQHYRFRRALMAPGLVSVVIAVGPDDARVTTCIETLRTITAGREIEIVCVLDAAIAPDRRVWVEQRVDTVLTGDEPFSRPRFHNLGAQAAKGDYLLFLDGDSEVIEPSWLDALLEHGQRDEIGVVGGRLLGADRRVRHAGIFWSARGRRPAFCDIAGTDPGYFGLARTERNVLAVSGACLLVRRVEFATLGGFDENLVVNSDVDFCLRCWERGKAVVYTPDATLLHHGATEGGLEDGVEFARRWGRKLEAGDPFYHPALSRDRDDYATDAEPLELVFAGRPLFERAQIHNILAVKLDHIGDFITAIPALQRLQAQFPQARLYMLAAPGTAALSGLVPGLAGTIEFEFFFPRSGRGQRELSDADFANLRRQLEPYHFDLAVDLRKAPETRPVLRHSGARWLAGFDHNGQFPWLDIVTEWDADVAGIRKHTHVGDDLLRLVEAVAIAASAPPVVGQRATAGDGGRRPGARRIVCVHPAVGSPIRQWPAAHFATLIDLLAQAHDVDVVLIGAQEEAGIAADVMAGVQRVDVVRSMVGKLALRELPRLLASAALFVGNNSGPQHLAAALGVPTVGVHSGTVDAREWGPMASNAVAVRRDVVCSPCYFSDSADCPRDLACLTELQPFAVYEICRRLLAIEAG